MKVLKAIKAFKATKGGREKGSILKIVFAKNDFFHVKPAVLKDCNVFLKKKI